VNASVFLLVVVFGNIAFKYGKDLLAIFASFEVFSLVVIELDASFNDTEEPRRLDMFHGGPHKNCSEGAETVVCLSVHSNQTNLFLG